MSFGLGLPATVAIFPQMAQIDAVDVEEKFQGLRNGQEDGQRTTQKKIDQ